MEKEAANEATQDSDMCEETGMRKKWKQWRLIGTS